MLLLSNPSQIHAIGKQDTAQITRLNTGSKVPEKATLCIVAQLRRAQYHSTSLSYCLPDSLEP
jgi:hypothetical protein